MSRIGKKIINLPPLVSFEYKDEKIIIGGKYGKLEKKIPAGIRIEQKENQLCVLRENELKQTQAFHGLIRALLQNMITGVNEKFSKSLIVEGVGYRFQLNETILILLMGFSHPIELKIPEDLSLTLESPTKLIISGIDKEQVGFFASQIRKIKPPEPYKGKGIRYENEKIIRKVGKTGK